jgi:hypothetical protein
MRAALPDTQKINRGSIVIIGSGEFCIDYGTATNFTKSFGQFCQLFVGTKAGTPGQIYRLLYGKGVYPIFLHEIESGHGSKTFNRLNMIRCADAVVALGGGVGTLK